MRDGGRLQAVIEILADIEARKRPVTDALKDWGLSHRFAGSGDRAAIGNLVHDALRKRRSLADAIGSDTPRGVVLAVYALTWKKGVAGLEAALTEPHAPEPLSEDERARLSRGTVSDDPAIDGDIPDWLVPSFARVYGEGAGMVGQHLARRAPVDIRVNALKARREDILPLYEALGAMASTLVPNGIRIPVGEGPARPPHIESDPEFLKGLIEIQDEGSQVAALVSGARPGEQVLDLCAGGGGKTLALAADMANKGQIYAYDSDKRRMRDLFERSERAGLRNLQVLTPGRGDPLTDLEGRMDLVLVDAPCTGTGTWRRRPDAKWRLSERALETRMRDQDGVLETASGLVKPGGRIVYITCSVLAEENEDRIAAFLHRHPEMGVIDPLSRISAALAKPLANFVRSDLAGFPVVRLDPWHGGTDGFFVAMLQRQG
jgi:16S rRNA (cytosine967-C5)-methyltransferase